MGMQINLETQAKLKAGDMEFGTCTNDPSISDAKSCQVEPNLPSQVPDAVREIAANPGQDDYRPGLVYTSGQENPTLTYGNIFKSHGCWVRFSINDGNFNGRLDGGELSIRAFDENGAPALGYGTTYIYGYPEEIKSQAEAMYQSALLAAGFELEENPEIFSRADMKKALKAAIIEAYNPDPKEPADADEEKDPNVPN